MNMKNIHIVIIVIVLGILVGAYFGYDIGFEKAIKGEDKSDLIVVKSPKPGEEITSPVKIKGEARGPWFFEADFPVVLTDWDGRIIGQAIATAEGEWMTEDFVPFEALLYFDADPNAYSDKGTLIFQKDNPSGLPEHDDALEFDVKIISGGETDPNPTIEQELSLPYEDEETGMKFEYRVSPKGYILEELQIGNNEDPNLIKAIILTRIADYEELQNSEGAREGPPTLNVYVFNSNGVGLGEWLEGKRSFTNFNSKTSQSFIMGGVDGLYFTWDGLYQGETVAIQRGDKVYMVVGTYLSGVEDGRRTDFQNLVNSFSFLN